MLMAFAIVLCHRIVLVLSIQYQQPKCIVIKLLLSYFINDNLSILPRGFIIIEISGWGKNYVNLSKDTFIY